MALDTLYKEIVLAHYKNPHNFGHIPEEWTHVEGENPSCGDQFRIGMALEGGVISDIRFEGRGCAVSMSACSLLTEHVKGKTLAEAGRLIEDYLSAMKGEGALTGELAAFSGVCRFPARVVCATLCWEALLRSINARMKEESECVDNG